MQSLVRYLTMGQDSRKILTNSWLEGCASYHFFHRIFSWLIPWRWDMAGQCILTQLQQRNHDQCQAWTMGNLRKVHLPQHVQLGNCIWNAKHLRQLLRVGWPLRAPFFQQRHACKHLGRGMFKGWPTWKGLRAVFHKTILKPNSFWARLPPEFHHNSGF